MKKAVILLSGGLDSATTLFWAKNKGYKAHCLIFNYGQRHKREIGSAVKIAKAAKSEFQIIRISLPWKGSSLLDNKINIPVAKMVTGSVVNRGIPNTYVPARNTIFLSFALSYAEAIGAGSIFIGANAVDFSGYPDCRPGYYRIFNRLAKAATKKGVAGASIEIVTPLIRKTKADIVRTAVRLRVPLGLTWSCYKGGKKPCGRCDSCLLRKKGFSALQMEDPAYD
ncbi:MAG: 7-cyano-7-deazaguanine synthase QueC [Candidatus Omnitrophota bacterium]|nr:7-cyano-7-deazaguanine synthase QueC [Candidatus Omnitrophota bacterium]